MNLTLAMSKFLTIRDYHKCMYIILSGSLFRIVNWVISPTYHWTGV